MFQGIVEVIMLEINYRNKNLVKKINHYLSVEMSLAEGADGKPCPEGIPEQCSAYIIVKFLPVSCPTSNMIARQAYKQQVMCERTGRRNQQTDHTKRR